MKKLTLQFSTLEELVRFSKVLQSGYRLNTSDLTLKTMLPEANLARVLQEYQAKCLDMSDDATSAAA